MKRFESILFLFFLFMINSRVLFPEQISEDRIIHLENRISLLEKRLEIIETALNKTINPIKKESKRGASRSVNVNKDQDYWRLKENWWKTEEGMSFAQVQEILGNPTRKDMIIPDQGTWYYEGFLEEANTTVSGNVYFQDRRAFMIRPPVW